MSWFTSLTESVSTVVSILNSDENELPIVQQARAQEQQVQAQAQQQEQAATGNTTTTTGATLFEKLTLTTTEFRQERERFDQEERRKEQVKNLLASRYVWDTSDTDRSILVDECKDTILQLSTKMDTFFGPYQLPPLAAKITTTTKKKKRKSKKATTETHDDQSKDTTKDGDNITNQETDDEDGGTEDEDAHDNDADEEGEEELLKDPEPSIESLSKLEKLRPLPDLLENFDLAMHVGLIQKMLTVDTNLVRMQSQYSGGGIRELFFWKNYFIHIAYARYETGLSIDEIWSLDPNTAAGTADTERSTLSSTTGLVTAAATSFFSTLGATIAATIAASDDDVDDNDDDENEVEKEGEEDGDGNATTAADKPEDKVAATTDTATTTQVQTPVTTSPTNSDYEIIDASQGSPVRPTPTMPLVPNSTNTLITTTNTNSGNVIVAVNPADATTATAAANDNDGIDYDDVDISNNNNNNNYNDDDDFLLQPPEDYELDELEAEIARELED